MRLEQLIAGLMVRVAHGDARRDVRDLTDDSRQVTPGCLFIARAGAGADADGRRFIPDAIARGAGAVLAEGPLADDLPEHVTVLSADQVDQALAGQLACRLFDHPHQKLRLIGITGTNGKTTTAWIVRHLLNASGRRCGLIGTVAVDDGSTAGPAVGSDRFPVNTTPGAIEFVRLLARMVANGCRAAVAEVSSHALHQGRADALRFDAAVFTNLSGDHLDYHQTMDAYAHAKAQLFSRLKPAGWAIVNADDSCAETMLAAMPAGSRVMPCRRLEPGAEGPGPQHVTAIVRHATAEGSEASFHGPWGTLEVMLPLVGPHNVTNALQALAAAHAGGAPGSVLGEALAACRPVPGRLERVVRTDAPAPGQPQPAAPTVLVDYAHTHDALDNVLRALRPLTAERLIVLFGCGGDRDRTKRPKMAEVAHQWADVIFVTSDNPRTETPQRIIDDIMAGFAGGRPDGPEPDIRVEPDRAEAIRAAIGLARAGDTVLLAGKGHEDYQIIGDARRHFDDREHAAAALADGSPARPADAPAVPSTPTPNSD